MVVLDGPPPLCPLREALAPCVPVWYDDDVSAFRNEGAFQQIEIQFIAFLVEGGVGGLKEKEEEESNTALVSLTGVLLQLTAGSALESTPGKEFSISNPMHYIREVPEGGGAEAPLVMHSKLIPWGREEDQDGMQLMNRTHPQSPLHFITRDRPTY